MSTCRIKPFLVSCLACVSTLASMPGAGLSQCPEEPALAGTWEWERTYGGFAGEVYTPASIGHTQQVVFTAGGVMHWFIDEVLQEPSPYNLTCVQDGPGAWEWRFTSESGLFMDNPNFQKRVEIVDGFPVIRLILRDTCWDCYEFAFSARTPLVGNADLTWGAVKRLH